MSYIYYTSTVQCNDWREEVALTGSEQNQVLLDKP